MRRRLLSVLLSSALCVPLLSGCDSNDGGASDEPFKLLVFSRTESFRHDSIETGVETIRQLGLMHGFSVDHTEDPAAFTLQNLNGYAAVLWLSTTGNVLEDAQRQAFEQYIRSGGGYAGVHSASDTEYDWPFYGELVSAYFHSHPIFPLGANGGPGVQSGNLHAEAPDHPSTAHLPTPWTVSDEFYSFRSNPRGQVRVLMNIDEASYNQDPNTTNIGSTSFLIGETGTMNDHPMSWCHDRLGGRAWYTALGHSVAIYDDPHFRRHLLNGILTAAGQIPADCEPREDGPLAEPNTGPALPPQIPFLNALLQLLAQGRQ